MLTTLLRAHRRSTVGIEELDALTEHIRATLGDTEVRTGERLSRTLAHLLGDGYLGDADRSTRLAWGQAKEPWALQTAMTSSVSSLQIEA